MQFQVQAEGSREENVRGANTSYDNAFLNGEKFKKPLWNIFFLKFRSPNKISFTIVILIRDAQEAILIRHSLSS